MNFICTPQRNKLISNISHLISIKLLDLPLKDWDPTKYVKSWLRKGNHSTSDLRIKKKRKEELVCITHIELGQDRYYYRPIVLRMT